jgi:hypothetical protein
MSARSSDGDLLRMLGLMLQREEGVARPRPVSGVGIVFPQSTVNHNTTTQQHHATSRIARLQREQELDLGDFRVWVNGAKRHGPK